MKHWKLDIIGFWVIGAGCYIKKSLKRSSNTPNRSKDFTKILILLIYQLTKFAGLMRCGSKDIFKIHPVSWTNNHHDVTSLVNHGIVKNTKTWISRELNITFLWSKNILNLCLRCRVLRSYHFVAEVTFKGCVHYIFASLFF